jgi:hypothetical protein
MGKNDFKGEPTIRGGPFLELSFLITFNNGRKQFIVWFYNEFKKFISTQKKQ